MAHKNLIKSFMLTMFCLFISNPLFGMIIQNTEATLERKFLPSSIEYSFIASKNKKFLLDRDFNEMINIFKNSYNETGLSLGIHLTNLNNSAQSIMAEFWSRMAIDEVGFFIVARQGRQVVGFSYFEKTRDPAEIMLKVVVVKKSHRKHEIGSTLVFAIFDDLPNVKYIKADLNSYQWQESLEEFYKKIHFQEENVCIKLTSRQNTHKYMHKKFLRYTCPEFR